MRSLYFRIWLTVVAALALFAGVSGWLVNEHVERTRVQREGVLQERLAGWATLLQRALPEPEAPQALQAEAVREWSERLRLPMALDDASGRRVAASDSFLRRESGAPAGAPQAQPVRLDDGRTLWLVRPGPALRRAAADRGPMLHGPHGLAARPWWSLPGVPDGVGVALLLALLLAAVAAGAWPVVRRLTRRLEALKHGVEAFGRGQLQQRVAEDGRDEVAALGAAFNQAAGRIQALLAAHKSLLANASHELRSPLARLKMALSMLDGAGPAERRALQREIATDIAELDALVEEVLLASRLEAEDGVVPGERVDLLVLAAEEAARVQAVVHGADLQVHGDERLLRRALRNLLENARRYGGGAVEVEVALDRASAPPTVALHVDDRGPGVPPAFRQRIFEPFFRLPGHAERAGGVGLGLALVRQIAERHGGSVHCAARDGGGSRFTLRLPQSPAAG